MHEQVLTDLTSLLINTCTSLALFPIRSNEDLRNVVFWPGGQSELTPALKPQPQISKFVPPVPSLTLACRFILRLCASRSVGRGITVIACGELYLSIILAVWLVLRTGGREGRGGRGGGTRYAHCISPPKKQLKPVDFFNITQKEVLLSEL